MKKAVIQSGSRQYLVKEGDNIEVELLKTDKKSIDFEALLVIDEKNTLVGSPSVANVKVTADVIEADVAGDKVTSIRYKAKKRVKTVRGHRQHHAILKIKKIA
jgi:large subunit ribosomal protein L21